MKTRALRIAIDLAAIQHNLNLARQVHPAQKLFAVLKADAYGHGAVRVAKTLDGADAFAVVTLNEAIELREAAVEKPILVLQGAQARSDIGEFIQHQLWPVVHCEEQLSWFASTADSSELALWLKIDTGMGRLGFLPDRAQVVLRDHAALNWFGALTHFATADETDNPVTVEQIRTFHSLKLDSRLQTSLANSAGILAWPEAQADWARPGIMLYGSNPLGAVEQHTTPLRPAMRVSAPLISCKHYPAGATIGYGGSFTCPESMLVGYAAIGYGDGLPRVLDTSATVCIAGTRCPIIGRVSMDSIAVDLRLVHQPKQGTEVVLWGPEQPIDILSKAAGTISYELMTSIKGERSYN